MRTPLSLGDTLARLDQRFVRSSLSVNRLNQLLAQVASEYITLGIRLNNPKNAWMWGKLSGGAKGLQDVDALHAKYPMSEVLLAALRLATFTADIGRLLQVIEGKPQSQHGAASSSILSRLLADGELVEEEMLGAIREAITHHSAQDTPEEREFQGEAGYLLCLILRDLDKLFGWISSGRAYLVPAETERQRNANKLSERRGWIPEEVIERFETGRTINRDLCQTVEGWLLQFLAWKFDFNFEEIWQQVVADGAPAVVLAYVRDQLLTAGNMRQWLRIEAAAREHGVATLD